jgi:hypothetical protein
MAAYVKFNAGTETIAEKAHNFDTDTLKVYFSNTAPNVSTMSVKADLAEISTGNGYTAGGFDVQNATSRTGGVTSVTAVDITVTASGGSIGPYRYIVLYNDTATSDELIGWLDYGTSYTLTDTNTFTIPAGTAFTLA